VAEVEDVERTIDTLLRRLEQVPRTQRALLPGRRTVEARCPDLGLIRHARWKDGSLGPIADGPSPRRPDVRIDVRSDDLLALHRGELTVTRAWADGRLKVRASMGDMLRLRTALG
jgi:hypothetical protein